MTNAISAGPGVTIYFKNGDDGYITVTRDEFPENPITFYDPVGTFLTWERQSISPSPNPYPTASDFMIDAVGEQRANTCRTMQDCIAMLDNAGYAVRGIYRLEHSLVKYELGESNPFADPWDSAAVGFAFTQPEKLYDEGLTKAGAIRCMENELREYNEWINGEVYQVTMYDREGQEIGGGAIYGMDSVLEENLFAEPIDLSGFASLTDYIEHNAMTEVLESEWTFQPARTDLDKSRFVNGPMAIVEDRQSGGWRIADGAAGRVSFAEFKTPQEALSQLTRYQSKTEQELSSFLPKNRPLSELADKAKDRAAEKNAQRSHADKGKDPDLGR